MIRSRAFWACVLFLCSGCFEPDSYRFVDGSRPDPFDAETSQIGALQPPPQRRDWSDFQEGHP